MQVHHWSPLVGGWLHSALQRGVFGPTSCRTRGAWPHRISLHCTRSVWKQELRLNKYTHIAFPQTETRSRRLFHLFPYLQFEELLHKLPAVQRVVSQEGFESLDTQEIVSVIFCLFSRCSLFLNPLLLSLVLTLYSAEWSVVRGSPFPSPWTHCSRHWHTEPERTSNSKLDAGNPLGSSEDHEHVSYPFRSILILIQLEVKV